MPVITVTIITPASGPFELAQLFAGNTYSGAVSILPATPPTPPSKPNYLSVYGKQGNSANILVGDQNLTPAVSGCIGKQIAAGAADVMQGPGTTPLVGRFINAEDANDVALIEAYGGFQ